MDLLIAGNSPSRVITVSSHWHVFPTINFDDLMMEKGFWSAYAYAQSKLANVLFTRELARRLQGNRPFLYCTWMRSFTVIFRCSRHTSEGQKAELTYVTGYILKWFIPQIKAVVKLLCPQFINAAALHTNSEKIHVRQHFWCRCWHSCRLSSAVVLVKLRTMTQRHIDIAFFAQKKTRSVSL